MFISEGRIQSEIEERLKIDGKQYQRFIKWISFEALTGRDKDE